MVNDLNGVPILVPPSFKEDVKGYPGKPRAVADADNKIGYSEVYSDDPRSLEELVKDHYVGVEDNDRNIGAVLKEIESQGQLDKTAVLLSSDHGFFLGEHHLYDKRLMYEPSIRVPMLLRYPGKVKAGATSDEMVLNLDLAPTLLQDGRATGVQPKCRARVFFLLPRGRRFPGARTGSTSTTNIQGLRT